MNELLCLGVGLWIGAGAGLLTATFLLGKTLNRKNKIIAGLKAQLTLKEILTPIVQHLVKSVMDPFLGMYKNDFKETPKDETKPKRKNNIH